MRRIGLFGGSFDPVHNAHVAVAKLALDHLALDELRWIPVGQPWQKSRRLTEARHREAMVRLAMGSEPRFKLDRCELERPGPSYTLDTVRALQDAEPAAEWFLLIGQDQYAGLHTWTHWQELLDRVTLAVANRPGPLAPVNPEVLRRKHRKVDLPPMDVSSTGIRHRLGGEEPIDALVPPAVASYIDQHHLYRLDEGTPARS